jgi:DNA invertase Pin-like site-specific DNA recombinase
MVSFQTSIMANLYTIFSQMERQLINERTKQGLQIAKQKGHLKGRKRGIKKNKLDERENEIKELIDKKMSIRKMEEKMK